MADETSEHKASFDVRGCIVALPSGTLAIEFGLGGFHHMGKATEINALGIVPLSIDVEHADEAHEFLDAVTREVDTVTQNVMLIAYKMGAEAGRIAAEHGVSAPELRLGKSSGFTGIQPSRVVERVNREEGSDGQG